MDRSLHGARRWLLPIVAAAWVAAGCATMERGALEHRVVLQGSQENPPVSTVATGSGVITIRPDGSVSGSVTTSGINATAAHIHQGARGVNGPVIVPMVKSGDFTWSFPAGSKLTEAQYAAHRAGNLYVNVHSAAHPGGEIRGQISGN
jgi:CHRD domain-containing protein